MAMFQHIGYTHPGDPHCSTAVGQENNDVRLSHDQDAPSSSLNGLSTHLLSCLLVLLQPDFPVFYFYKFALPSNDYTVQRLATQSCVYNRIKRRRAREDLRVVKRKKKTKQTRMRCWS